MKNRFSEEFPFIGAPAFRALASAGIENLQDLTKYSQKELLSLHGFGPRALRLLVERLKQQGLTLAEK